MKALWKGLTPFATHLTLKYALRFGTNALYSNLLRDKVSPTSPPCHSNVSLCEHPCCSSNDHHVAVAGPF